MYIFQDDDENSQEDAGISRSSTHITEAQDNNCLHSSQEESVFGHLVEEDVTTSSTYNAIVEPDELMALANDVSAAETANLLLPEHQTNNFVDFDEFNICLNNILSEDVDADPELSPSMIADTMSPTDIDQMFKVNTVVQQKSNTTPILPTLSSDSNVLNSSSSHSSSEFSNDILNMVQFEHIEFNFESELVGRSAAATSCSSSSPTSKMHGGGGGAVGGSNNYSYMAEESLGLNLVDTVACNPTATVSASVTTAASNNDDDTQAALNVIKRNSHSIVNIFQ